MYSRILSVGLVISAIFCLMGCGGTGNDNVANLKINKETISITLSLPESDVENITSVVAYLTADGIDTIESELSIIDGTVTGTISDIPPGYDRHIKLQLFNADGIMILYGDADVDILSDEPVNVHIILHYSDGSVVITGLLPESDAENVAGAVAYITADDIDTIESELSIEDGTVTESTIGSIPLGSDRHIELQLFDADSIMIFRGEAVVDILSGEAVEVQITLESIRGTVIINGTIEDSTVAENIFETDDETIALWLFNEETGSTVMDNAGDHTLSLRNEPAWVSGIYGGALSFNGNSCDAENAMEFYPASAITVEAYVFIESLPPAAMSPRSHSMIVSNSTWSGSNCTGYELRLTDSDGKVEFIFGDENGWHSAISKRTVETETWYNIAGQYDGNLISVYVNGELWASTTYSSTIQSNSIGMHIARRGVDQPFYFYGTIDEIRISSTTRY